MVTGAASGIGFGIAQRFAEEGARVALIDIDAERCREAEEQIAGSGGICAAYPTDVGNEQEVVRVFEEVISRFKEIDHLVNNAGVLLTKGIADCTVAEWDRVMDVNVKSVFLTVKSLLKWVSTPSHATVVNVGSVSSFVAQQGTPAYVASEAPS